MQKNLWAQLFRLMKVQGLVIYNAAVWSSTSKVTGNKINTQNFYMLAMNTWTQKLKILFVTVPRKIKSLIYRPYTGLE